MERNCTCGMCQGGCAVTATIEDGVLTKIRPNRDSPNARLCPRGAQAPTALYGEQRIKQPLIRTGARGEGLFRPATWDEALDHAAKLVQKVVAGSGARAMASYFGRGVLATPVTRLGMCADTPLKRLGSPNDMDCVSICNMSSCTVTPVTVFGLGVRQMVQDMEHCDLIFSWGKNSASDDGPQPMLKRIKAAQQRGAKLIVIDPRREGLGELADWWVPVTPGSDGALALAMLKLIIERERYDRDFVRTFTRGFDGLCSYVGSLDLVQLSAWCGVAVADIERLADLFCSTEKATLVSYTGLEYQLSAVQNNRAIMTLWGITGKVDVEGGIYLNAQRVETFPLKDPPQGSKPIGADEFPLFYRFTGEGQFSRFPKAVLEDDPYPLRGLLVVGGSPAVSFPDSGTWHRAYNKLECLLVVDRFLTEEARFADVVFPARSLFESPRILATPDGPAIEEPVLEPVGEARDDVLIVSALAERLGVGAGLPQDGTQLREWMLADSTPYTGDFTVRKEAPVRQYRKYLTGDLRADGRPGFPTPSGKMEIASTYLEECGFTPYPEYRDIRSLPVMADPEMPFTLATGARNDNRMGAFGANLPGINVIEPFPLLDIAEEDAAEEGIAAGDMVRVTTPFGSKKFRAHPCGMARRALHLPHGGGSFYMPDAWRDGNVNDLCSLDYCDPLTGFVTIKSVPCKIERVG